MSDTTLHMNLRTNGIDPVDVEEFEFEPIKGYPMLNWRGKRPFRSTHYYPAQLKEVHGEEADGWRNKIYWGDNLQVMGHLLKAFRGQVDLVYIDPPFDSKADYKMKVHVRGKQVANDRGVFEEKQYTDIWANDDYLQFIFERLVVIRELMSTKASLWFHCDWHRSHHVRCILDEVFGSNNFQNEVIWQRTDPHNDAKSRLGWVHDTLFWYAKDHGQVVYNWQDVVIDLSEAALNEYSLVKLPDGSVVPYSCGTEEVGRRFKLDDCTYKGNDQERRFSWRGARPSPKRVWPYSSVDEMDAAVAAGEFYLRNPEVGAARCRVSFLDERDGQVLQTIWTDTGRMKGGVDYPTQKPSSLLERIVLASSMPGDLVLDCFMGSGTTQVVSAQLGRRYIGADINSGAIQLTTKFLLEEMENHSRKVASASGKLGFDEAATSEAGGAYAGFEVYTVNRYDVFRNPVEAKDLLLEALEIERLPDGTSFDGQKDGRMVKIMPVDRIATRADLNALITGFDYKAFERRQTEDPRRPVEKITLVCMGHEPDLAALLEKEARPYVIDVEVVDILRDRGDLQFKRDSEAKVSVKEGWLTIEAFYPMNLLQKLSLEKEKVGDWREMVDSIMVDWNYDGAVFTPAVVDVPEKADIVSGRYRVPEGAATIRVKITDVLSESLEVDVDA